MASMVACGSPRWWPFRTASAKYLWIIASTWHLKHWPLSIDDEVSQLVVKIRQCQQLRCLPLRSHYDVRPHQRLKILEAQRAAQWGCILIPNFPANLLQKRCQKAVFRRTTFEYQQRGILDAYNQLGNTLEIPEEVRFKLRIGQVRVTERTVNPGHSPGHPLRRFSAMNDGWAVGRGRFLFTAASCATSARGKDPDALSTQSR